MQKSDLLIRNYLLIGLESLLIQQLFSGDCPLQTLQGVSVDVIPVEIFPRPPLLSGSHALEKRPMGMGSSVA